MASSSSTQLNEIGNNDELTPLEKHVMFFDINKDGIIYPWETYQGFRKLGRNVFRSVLAAVLIHVVTSGKTRPGKWPHPLFPIEIKNIKFGKHGSDSDAYDSEGRFVPEKFEEIFKKYAHTNSEYLTSEEVDELLKKNREPKNYFGWLNAMTDWRILFSVGKNKDGVLTKDAVKNVYDGSLFEQKAKEVAAKKMKSN
ncbi:putative peroxygenase 4 isoform X1 [Capsicum chacoense]|uniref:probable peroxygenase 4 isoform X1 n=1 Tax=Capsicum annuum TaxID=4072 RepID=UPI0007BF3752|nr:probable peroxygenase 4 isoform X1 [Capsicum annuum]KAF3681123.1 putative peroxygenase 4 [Capsicum annuum]